MATTYNTGNAIGSADPRDAYDNASNFDEFSNSSAQGFTDRRGVSRKTITGATAGYAAFNVTGAWTTSTAYNVNDVWSDSGTFYLVLTDYTSGASAAADIAGGNVIVHQPKDWVVPIETVSDLRAFEPSIANQQIELLGHTNPGLGGGIFWHDASDTTTADDDGVTIVTAGGKRWKRVVNGDIYFPWYGAQATSDDTAAVESATLNNPEGTFRWFGTLNVDTVKLSSNQSLVGFGYGSILKHNAGSTDSCVRLRTPATDTGITVKNFRLDGNKANQTSAVDGVNLDQTGAVSSLLSRNTVSGLYVYNTKGSGVVHAFPSRDSDYYDIVIYNCDNHGLLVRGSDSHFSNINIGQSGENGVFIYGGSANQLTTIKSWFSGRIAATTTGDGFSVRASARNMLTECEAQENEGHGLNLFDGTSRTKVTGFSSESDNKSAGLYHGLNINNADDNDVDIHIDSNTYTQSDGVNISGGSTGNTVNAWVGGVLSYKLDGTAADINYNNTVTLRNVEKMRQVLAGTGVVTVNWYAGTEMEATLTGNVTLNSNSGSRTYNGKEITITLTQDATGGRTVTFGTGFRLDPANPALVTTASTTSIWKFRGNGAQWVQTSYQTGM